MELTYYGSGCVLVATKQLKILVDPPSTKLPGIKPDVILKTVATADEFAAKDGFVIAQPGEYELKGVVINGIPAQLHIDDPKQPLRGVMYVIEAADVRLLVTGDISGDLKDDQEEQIDEVDLMVLPVGGHGLTLDATAAAKLVSQFEPRWVVPVHYDDGKTKYEMPQDKVDLFLKEEGAEGTKPEPKLKVTGPDLSEETTVVVLEVST